jgi:hypothetical protein
MARRQKWHHRHDMTQNHTHIVEKSINALKAIISRVEFYDFFYLSLKNR